MWRRGSAWFGERCHPTWLSWSISTRASLSIRSDNGMFDQGAALRNWMSWCAADLVLFNSHYHLRRVADALPGFLTHQPDKTHLPKLDEVVSRFDVFAVGVDLAEIGNFAADPDSDEGSSELLFLDDALGHPRMEAERGTYPAEVPEMAPSHGPPVILWPHRWERDKDPAAFLRALDKVVAAGLEFRLVLAGQDPPSGSASAASDRDEAAKRFGAWTLSSGELTRERYPRRPAAV